MEPLRRKAVRWDLTSDIILSFRILVFVMAIGHIFTAVRRSVQKSTVAPPPSAGDHFDPLGSNSNKC